MAIGSLLDKLPAALGVKPATMAYAGSVTSIVSGAASVIGFFMQRNENRTIIGDLKQVKAYLHRLDQRITNIERQNKRILASLDQLPDRIAKIVNERVNLALLNERYNTLASIRTNYINLNDEERKRYRVSTVGWDRLSEALTYLFRHENRISKLFEILGWCEFALVASEGRGASVIQSLINTKCHMVIPLFEELRDQLLTSHNELTGLLGSQYVANYSFGDDTTDLDNIHYDLASRKIEYTTEWFIVSAPGKTIINGGAEVERTVSLPANIEFNKKLDIFEDNFKDAKNDLVTKLQQYLEVRDLLLMFLSYTETVEKDHLWLVANPLSTQIDSDFPAPDGSDFVAMR